MKSPKSFLLLILIPFIASCATQVSDSISSSSYSSAESDEYISTEKIETNLEDLIYFEFDKASLSSDSKTLISKYMGSLEDDDTELKIFVNEELERLKEELKENMGIEEFQTDDSMKSKVGQVHSLLEGFRSKKTLKKDDLVFILKAQQLVKEIKG